MELRLETSYKQIFGLALPISLAMLVPQINFITNNVFLGQLGETELASAGITGVYYLIFAVIGNGLNNGLQALIARRAGQNLPKEIGRLFYHGVWVALTIAGLGILVTYSFGPAVLSRLIHSEAISKQVIDFLLIRIWGLPFLYLYVMRNALLVGTNNTRFLVWGTLSEAVVNIVLDYGLIYGNLGLPALGFNGAAYASIIAEGTGLFVIYAIIHFKGFHKSFSFFEQTSFEFPVFKMILVYSSPLILQYSISIASWEYFYILIEHHGERALAVSNAMRNIFGLFGIFSWAFASTTNTIVSNIIGQNRHEEVMPVIKRIATLSFAISFVIFVALNLTPETFLGFYGQGESFIDYAIPVIRVVSIGLLLMAFATVWLNAVTGTGNTQVNLIIELVTLVAYCIYVYLVLEYFNLPITWGWASEWIYWLVIVVMAYAYMKSGRWKSKRL
jgi:multidrug resistance protein, MATE family